MTRDEWIIITEEGSDLEDAPDASSDREEEIANAILTEKPIHNYVMIMSPIKELLVKRIIFSAWIMTWNNRMPIVNCIARMLLKYVNYNIYRVIVAIGVIIYIKVSQNNKQLLSGICSDKRFFFRVSK